MTKLDTMIVSPSIEPFIDTQASWPILCVCERVEEFMKRGAKINEQKPIYINKFINMHSKLNTKQAERRKHKCKSTI